MAMYVLLSFESDEDAMTLVDDMLNYKDCMLYTPVQENGVHPVVEGIYKKPTKFCDALNPIHGNKRVHGWTQGQKYGWWICGKCGLPSPVASRNVPNEISGWNLLSRLFVIDPVVPDSYGAVDVTPPEIEMHLST